MIEVIKAALGVGTEEQKMRTKYWENAFQEFARDKRRWKVVTRKSDGSSWSHGKEKLNRMPVKNNIGLGNWSRSQVDVV